MLSNLAMTGQARDDLEIAWHYDAEVPQRIPSGGTEKWQLYLNLSVWKDESDFTWIDPEDTWLPGVLHRLLLIDYVDQECFFPLQKQAKKTL